ncbi:hypothetical protein EGD00_07830 [Pectobacterium carotovorum subsp. carotovorum]|nr:hypothetical protein EGD00_07830 [Pectobacterium carotovorum subsp. carotovorum]
MKINIICVLTLFYSMVLFSCNNYNLNSDTTKIDEIVNRSLKASWQYESLKYNKNIFVNDKLNEFYVFSVYDKNVPDYQRVMYDYFNELKLRWMLKSNIDEMNYFLKKQSCKDDNHFNRCIYLLNQVKDNHEISKIIYEGSDWPKISSKFFNDEKNNEKRDC